MARKVISFRIDEELLELAHTAAEVNGCSLAAIICAGLERILKHGRGELKAAAAASKKNGGGDRSAASLAAALALNGILEANRGGMACADSGGYPGLRRDRDPASSTPRPVLVRELAADGAAPDGIAHWQEELVPFQQKTPTTEEQCLPDDLGRYQKCFHGRNKYRCLTPLCRMVTGR